MTGLEPLIRLLSMLVALALGEGFPASDAADQPSFLPLVANLREAATGLAEREPLDGLPPRRLIPLADEEALDGPADARRSRSSAARREPADRGEQERAARNERPDRRVRGRPARVHRPVREAAGNGGTASASANGGAVAIGAIPGEADIDGNATVVETSTEDGVAIAIDASGDAATASAAGQDGIRAGSRADGSPRDADPRRSARDRAARRGSREDG